jgi:DNA repair exonuclease SbcCD ATPase subunit
VTPTKLTLTNFCQHPYLSVELHRGLTAITGPNGCGKSNFCSTGMSFAITGKALGSVNKSELLRRGTSSGHTEIEFVHDGKECRLVRNLHNSGVKLHGLSEEPLSRKEANDMMIEILGQSVQRCSEVSYRRKASTSCRCMSTRLLNWRTWRSSSLL